MSKVSFDVEAVKELCARYDVPVPQFSRDCNKSMKFDGLPILPFLIELAQVHGLQPEMLEVEHQQGTTGCPTCGPDMCEFIVREKTVR